MRRIKVRFCILASRIHESAKRELKNQEIHELNTSLLLYPLKILIHGRKLVGKYDIIHHMSPFAIGKDFNLLALAMGDKPFVIGPIEIPHEFFEDEFEFLRIPVFAKLFKDSRVRRDLSIKTLEKCNIAVAVNNQTKKFLSNFIDEEKYRSYTFRSRY